MNIIRGIDRIAVVLAVVSIVPGFIGGWDIYKEERTVFVKVSAEDFLKDKIPKLPPGFVLEKPPPRFVLVEKKHEPPNWQCAIAGIAGAGVAFFIVLLGIRGIARVFLWIVKGFKEEPQGGKP